MVGRNAPWFGWGLALVAVTSLGCRRHQAAPAPAMQGAVVAAPAQVAPGEFVYSPRRVVLSNNTVRIPIDLVTYMPVLTYTGADGIRHRMLLDTGADTAMVSPALVHSERLTTRPSDFTYRDASGSLPSAGTARIQRLDLGPVRFEEFDAGIAPLYAGADALLGWPVWRDMLVTIDYPQRTLVLTQGSLPPPDGKTILPLKNDQGRLMVPVTLDGRELWLEIDTGWGVGSSVELTPATAAKVNWASAPVPTITTAAVQGTAPEKLGRLRGDLLVGRYRFTQPIAGNTPNGAVDILGAVALSNFAVTLDLRNLRIRFDRPGDAAIPSGPVWVCGFDCDLRSNPLKVLGVLPNSEADRAGLRPGDLLLSIDGHPALDGLLSHGGDPFQIELRRGEQIMRLSIPMTKLIP